MLIISSKVGQKLASKHGVNEEEVKECFGNREKGFLKDTREEHKTDPATLWFISETDHGRHLKIAFMQYPDGKIVIKSAYEPNGDEVRIYNKYA